MLMLIGMSWRLGGLWRSFGMVRPRRSGNLAGSGWGGAGVQAA
ncbi:MAG TPA: hypothetical protein VLI05_01455 [Candidatus Saccharimonadia bacterium]|nr:hypothetical protein [Candidatus Saccharimonadia bacterium]